ncbi:unnamed protein product, partial [Prorocentrum cordatum]
ARCRSAPRREAPCLPRRAARRPRRAQAQRRAVPPVGEEGCIPQDQSDHHRSRRTRSTHHDRGRRARDPADEPGEHLHGAAQTGPAVQQQPRVAAAAPRAPRGARAAGRGGHGSGQGAGDRRSAEDPGPEQRHLGHGDHADPRPPPLDQGGQAVRGGAVFLQGLRALRPAVGTRDVGKHRARGAESGGAHLRPRCGPGVRGVQLQVPGDDVLGLRHGGAGKRGPLPGRRLGDLMLPGLRTASEAELQNISWAFEAAGAHHGAVLSEVRRRLGSGGVGAADGCGATAPRASQRGAARARGRPADRGHARPDAGLSVLPTAQAPATAAPGSAPARGLVLRRLEVAEDHFACPEDAAATAQLRSCAEAAAAVAALEPAAGGRGQQAAGQGWVCTVKNTFVDVSDDGTSSDESEDEAPLGPSLECIPQGVIDPDELTAYRTSYQKFRSGKCRGAKGEVSHLGARA